MSLRPSFIGAWGTFLTVNLPVREVGRKIGGNVQKNIEALVNPFVNACPIRMSYVLNNTGFPIQKSTRYAMVSGGDKRQYIYRVSDMMKYLEDTFGAPDKTTSPPASSDLENIKGIVVVRGHGWGNATGHVTLWNGSICSDSCHFMYDPDNGTFIPASASIWSLN